MTSRRQFVAHAAVATLSQAAAAAAPRAAAGMALLAAAGIPARRAHATGLAERLAGALKGRASQLTVVLVDTTASVAAEDRLLLERAMQALVAAAQPGDRIVLAAVADRPASRFVAHADHRLPGGGNSLQDEVRGRRVRHALRADFEALRAAPATAARGTYLLDAVAAAAELLGQGRAAAQALQLVVLSDMIEESPLANFAREPVAAARAQRLLGQLRQRRLLPALEGVGVHVVGAFGRDAAHMAQVRNFWLAYFEAAGARVLTYGRAPLVPGA